MTLPEAIGERPQRGRLLLAALGAALLAAYQAREGDEAVDALMDEIGL